MTKPCDFCSIFCGNPWCSTLGDSMSVEPMFKDGDDTEVYDYVNIMIKTVDNGFIVEYINNEGDSQYVYTFDGNGPKQMLKDLVEELGISAKVKVD